jgi:hypothetical protein
MPFTTDQSCSARETVGGCRLADQGSAYDARCLGNKSATLIDVRLAPTSGAKADIS